MGRVGIVGRVHIFGLNGQTTVEKKQLRRFRMRHTVMRGRAPCHVTTRVNLSQGTEVYLLSETVKQLRSFRFRPPLPNSDISDIVLSMPPIPKAALNFGIAYRTVRHGTSQLQFEPEFLFITSSLHLDDFFQKLNLTLQLRKKVGK